MSDVVSVQKEKEGRPEKEKEKEEKEEAEENKQESKEEKEEEEEKKLEESGIHPIRRRCYSPEIQALKYFLRISQLSHLEEKFLTHKIRLDELEEVNWDREQDFQMYCEELQIQSQIDRVRLKTNIKNRMAKKKENAATLKKIIPMQGHSKSIIYRDLIREKKMPLVNIFVIGDSWVGKSSLIHQIDNKNLPSYYFASTIHIDIKRLFVETGHATDHVVCADLWDTGGQEKHDALPEGQMRKANGILLVYDVSVRATFANCNRWLDYICEIVESSKIALTLIGNKKDLRDEVENPVSEQEGLEYAREINETRKISTVFFEVSSITEDNISQLFIECVMRTYGIVYPEGFRPSAETNVQLELPVAKTGLLQDLMRIRLQIQSNSCCS